MILSIVTLSILVLGVVLYFVLVKKKTVKPYIKVSTMRNKKSRISKNPFLFWDDIYGQEWSGQVKSIRNGSGNYARGHEFYLGKDYQKIKSFTIVENNKYEGDYIEFAYKKKVNLVNFGLIMNYVRIPESIIIVGSNDLSNWKQIKKYEKKDILYKGSYNLLYKIENRDITNKEKYFYFRILFISSKSNTTGGYGIQELFFKTSDIIYVKSNNKDFKKQNLDFIIEKSSI